MENEKELQEFAESNHVNGGEKGKIWSQIYPNLSQKNPKTPND